MTATLTKWYEENGRHEIFAGGKAVPLTSRRALAEARTPRRWPRARSRISRRPACRRPPATSSCSTGPAKSASEAERRNAEMAKLYRQHVLKEPALLEIQGLSRGRPAPTAEADGAP